MQYHEARKERLMNTDKLILDACCGGRTFWFDKKHPDTLYIDIEPRPKGICAERPEFNCTPDIVMDFRQLPFADETFWHIVWDPPHLMNLMATSIMRKKYGTLQKETWQADLKEHDRIWAKKVLDIVKRAEARRAPPTSEAVGICTEDTL